MRSIKLALLLLLLPVVASAQITLQEAQDEADAWINPRIPDLTTDFEGCVATNPLSDCHPTWSSTVLPNTAPTDSALATVTNDDPGPFVTGCGGCYDDTQQTWVISGVDIPATSPVQMRTNTYQAISGTGVQAAFRFSYDGTIWERGVGMFGPAPDEDWREVLP
jgi:hypothetical protein